MITIIAERVRHDGGMRVALKFPYDQEIIDPVRIVESIGRGYRVQGARSYFQ